MILGTILKGDILLKTVTKKMFEGFVNTFDLFKRKMYWKNKTIQYLFTFELWKRGFYF
jgi:hypothetical protein